MVKSGTAPFSCMCHLLQNSTIWVGYNFMFWYFHVLVWIDLIGWYGSWVDLIGFLLLVLVGSFVCWFACMKYFKLGFLLLFYGTIVWRKKKVGIASGVFLLWSNLNFMVWIKSWKRKVHKCIFEKIWVACLVMGDDLWARLEFLQVYGDDLKKDESCMESEVVL